jgi:hypothetical protein
MTQLLLILVLLLGFSAAGLNIFSSLVYDFSIAKINKAARLHPYAKALRIRPKISIIIIAGNNPSQLQKCLQAIAKNRYRKYEIIVASQNLTLVKKTISDFKKKHRSKKIKALKISNSSWQEVANKVNSAGIYFILEDHYLIDETAISETVMYFAQNQNCDALLPHITNLFNYSLNSLVQQYEYIIQNQWQKTLSVFHKNNIPNSGFLACRKHPEKINHIAYCSNIKVYTTGQNFAPKTKNIWRIFLLLVAFITVSYALFIAFNVHYSVLIAIIWIGFSLFLALNIWSEEHINIGHKIKMLALAPMVSMLFYVSIIFRFFK